MKKIVLTLLICMSIIITRPLILQIGNPVDVQAATTVTTPKLLSARPSGISKTVIKWNIVKGARGYRIYRSTNGKNWKALKTIVGINQNTYVDSKLKKGSRYFYTVKAYKKVNGKTVWSSYDKKGIGVIVGLKTLKLSKKSISLCEGDTYTLKVVGTSFSPTWKSSNLAVASISSKGKITAKKAGTATITAKLNGLSSKCTITVKKSFSSVRSKYKQFLSKSSVKYYCIVEMGKTGMPVLLTADSLYDPYNKGSYTVSECNVHIVKNNKVTNIGKLTCRAGYCLMYDTNYFYCIRFHNTDKCKVEGSKLICIASSAVSLGKAKNIIFTRNTYSKLISKEQAIEKVRRKFGSNYGYFCDGILYTYKEKQYFVVDIKQSIDGHYTRITQYLVSSDNTVCREGYCYNRGEDMGLY